MLPTFVIGLREGLEAALIVGIIAAFLRKQGRNDLMRWVFIGVGTAVALCVAVGIVLDVVSQNLPQREQEGLETVIGVLAVGMVTYMVVWMKRHSRELKGQLEGMAAGAMTGTGVRAAKAMVLMAFLAVLREGFETAVFLLAAFNESDSGAAAPIGALLGILIAVGLGYGIYRGGLRLNLSKFFRATGLVLVFVAAGLVLNALHTAHEAGWLNAGQNRTIDLTWLVRPGSVQASLLTGMLGIQPRPVLIELIGWIVFLIPVGIYVAWPPGRGLPRPVLAKVLAASGVAAFVATAAFAIASPGNPAPIPASQSVDRTAFERSGSAVVADQQADTYTRTTSGTAVGALPATLSMSRIAELNNGHLPIGLRPRSDDAVPVRYRLTTTDTVWVASASGRILDQKHEQQVTVEAIDPTVGPLALAKPFSTTTTGFGAADVAAAARAEGAAQHQADRAALFSALAWSAGVVGGLLVLVAAGVWLVARRRPIAAVIPALDPVRETVSS